MPARPWEEEEGFVVPDGYLSEEERGADGLVIDLGDDDAAEGADAVGGGGGAAGDAGCVVAAGGDAGREERVRRDRARAQLQQWMERARRQNRPLVITSFPAAPGTPPHPAAAAAAAAAADGAGDMEGAPDPEASRGAWAAAAAPVPAPG